ncbi:hypothetical protein [Bacillus cereus]|uniref:Uncharacterized protein n=1 Tax=Bacillus cereus HuA4-10 TaxID=1053206 RepID=J8DY46_BACCE|nr:hypothetical protein [Bacillus cereus]EJQ84112.1 hypothetical protein IGC_01054 [Bacillus cereus HuA4-10]
MTELETSLQYEYNHDYNLRPEGINVQATGSFIRTHNILINASDRFQRMSIYENGVIMSEEIYNGKHFFRFNFPFTEIEPGKLVINN